MKTVRGWLVVAFALIANVRAFASDEWFRGLELEGAIAQSDLIMVARVADVRETAVIHGGKGESRLLQFTFEPVRTLKGVFARPQLSLTGNDLGGWRHTGALTQIAKGEMRLLLLGREGPGYANRNHAETLAHSLPILRDERDPLVAATQVLISVTQQHDRAKRLAEAVRGLESAQDAAAVALLRSIERRTVLASQTPGATDAIASRLNDASPAVREQAAQTLRAVIEADYLERSHAQALRSVVQSLERNSDDVAARVAAIRALGAAGDASIGRDAAPWVDVASASDTFAETAARLQSAAELNASSQRDAVLALFRKLPLDAPDDAEYAAGVALVALAQDAAPRELRARYDRTVRAGLDVQAEIRLLGELPPESAVPALLQTAKTLRSTQNRAALLFAAERLAEKKADPRLVPALAPLLDPGQPGLRRMASNVLLKIDAREAALALEPHLREEQDLARKLKLAEFLGRHGLREGYPYAIEHMSELQLREQAVAALSAIRDPQAIPALRNILRTSNDEQWNAAAIRALGALGDAQVTNRCLEIVKDLRHPLAPAALIALGDLREASALESVRAALSSRNDAVLAAGVRAGGKLLDAPNVSAEDVRDRIAAILADANAPPQARSYALDSLLALNDARLGDAAAAAILDAGLEGSELMSQIESLASSRKLELAQRLAHGD